MQPYHRTEMQITVSVKQLVSIGVIAVVAVLAVALTSSGALSSMQQSSTQSQHEIQSTSSSQVSTSKEGQEPTVQSQQISDVNVNDLRQFLWELSAVVEGLRNDINVLKTSVSSSSNVLVEEIRQMIVSQIGEVKLRVDDIEKRVGRTETQLGKIDELSAYVDSLKQQIVTLDSEIQSFKTGQQPPRLVPDTGTTEETTTEQLPGLEQPSPVEEVPPDSQSASTGQEFLMLSIDKPTYSAGDTVVISVKTNPDAFVDMKIVNSASVEVFKKVIKADSAGKFTVGYIIWSDTPADGYKIIATRGDLEKTSMFSVIKHPTAALPGVESSVISIKTDKVTYSRGDYMSVSGIAQPRSSITIVLVSPSGNESLFTANVNENGVYQRLLTISLDSTSGVWTVVAKQGENIASWNVTVV